MRSNLIFFSAFCLIPLLAIVTTVPLSANSFKVIYERNIEVQDNQFVLKIPDYSIILKETLSADEFLIYLQQLWQMEVGKFEG